jgi:hypothetical protein
MLLRKLSMSKTDKLQKKPLSSLVMRHIDLSKELAKILFTGGVSKALFAMTK